MTGAGGSILAGSRRSPVLVLQELSEHRWTIDSSLNMKKKYYME